MNKLYFFGRASLIAFFLVFATQSCNNLDEELFDTVTPDNFFQSDDEFIAALGAAYTSLYGFMGDFYAAQEVSSDEVVVPTRGADWDDGGHWRRLHQHLYTPDDPIINGAWNFCFGGVNTCNRLIFQFETLNAAGSDAFISELKAFRAVFYYWLLDLYGNVPLVTQFDVPTDFAPQNASRAEVYAFVESELTQALPVLSKTVGGEAYGRMNYWTAQMVLAKLYLNAEIYTGTPQWDKAEAAVDDIINNGGFALMGNYFDNFITDNQGSTEFIFAIPYDQVFATGNNLAMRTLHYGSQDTYNLTAQPWNGYASLQEFYESFSDDDVRKQSFIVGPQFKSDGSPVDDSGFDDPDGPQLNFTPEINELGPQAHRQAGARIGKWEFKLGATADLSNDMAIFRYGDVLLMKAELLLRKGDEAGALVLVNQLRTRAGTTELATLTFDDLLAERGRELCFEAHRRTDLIRFGKYNDPWQFKDASDPSKNVFPIPRGQIDANKNLVQNPGY